jgi:putative tricarboxylic transport membrane protein
MFDGLLAFGHSIVHFGTPTVIGYALLASLVGVVIGALPGLTATMGLALMTTMTLQLAHDEALLILICTYVRAIYGGSRSAILLNIPGTPASAASCRGWARTWRPGRRTPPPSAPVPSAICSARVLSKG